MLKFTKMHGLGNDYVYVDCFAQRLDGVDLPALARAMSDRHRGIGSDGLVLICPPSPGVAADARMEMYNADGSRAEMCGNGLRCVAKYLVDRRLVPFPRRELRGGETDQSRDRKGAVPAERPTKRSAAAPQRETVLPQTVPTGGDISAACELRIETDRGVLTAQAFLREGLVVSARVNMGPPILDPARIPVAVTGRRCVRLPVKVEGRTYHATCVSMGNPHAVIFVEEFDAFDLARLGPLVERHPLFPNRTNVHAAVVRHPREAAMRTWERGSGLTLACGTGACAVLVAGVLEERMARHATIRLPGGAMEIEWAESPEGVSCEVFMTGPAVEVFSGEWPT